MLQVLAEQKQSLQKQLIELAVTGAAFDKLRQSEALEQLLFFIRVFARFAPEQKVGLQAACLQCMLSCRKRMHLHTCWGAKLPHGLLIVTLASSFLLC